MGPRGVDQKTSSSIASGDVIVIVDFVCALAACYSRLSGDIFSACLLFLVVFFLWLLSFEERLSTEVFAAFRSCLVRPAIRRFCWKEWMSSLMGLLPKFFGRFLQDDPVLLMVSTIEFS